MMNFVAVSFLSQGAFWFQAALAGHKKVYKAACFCVIRVL